MFILLFSATAACQPTETQEEAATATVTEAPSASVVSERRPAPEFFAIPKEMLNKRVWICEDGVADVFHVKHDCPVLIECKGKGSFRNLLLPKAIEAYGRYNCPVCSEDLAFIYDEDAVRNLGE